MTDRGWRAAQRIVAFGGLILVSPLLAGLALAIRLSGTGPVLYRSIRIGRMRPFTMLKLRTMRANPDDDGPTVTAAGDDRVTRLGRFLRRTKLDELPQLWNVVRGEMLLVGPRLEDPRYVDPSDPLHQLVFGARPGITGPTALAYRDEEAVLAIAARDVAIEAGHPTPGLDDVERAYRERILPLKLTIDVEYLGTRSVRGDIAILARTLGQMSRHSRG